MLDREAIVKASAKIMKEIISLKRNGSMNMPTLIKMAYIYTVDYKDREIDSNLVKILLRKTRSKNYSIDKTLLNAKMYTKVFEEVNGDVEAVLTIREDTKKGMYTRVFFGTST